MTLREAAQQALEAIERALPHAPHCGEFDALADMADALRAALAEPVQEPQRKPLTDDQITAINASLKIGTTTELVRAIERAHGIGGDA